MHDPLPNHEQLSKAALYDQLARQVQGLLAGERDLIANAANTAAALYHALPEVNWVGFYLLQGEQLVVGPFQGKPACVRIPLGRGVCGNAARARRTTVVPDVHAYADHIACDPASRSEIVVPLLSEGSLLGVLDLDSPLPARFDDEDRRGLERIADIFLHACGNGARRIQD